MFVGSGSWAGTKQGRVGPGDLLPSWVQAWWILGGERVGNLLIWMGKG